MFDLFTWLLVFLRAAGLFMVFPVLSITNIPVMVRVALAALVAFLVSGDVARSDVVVQDLWGMVGIMGAEVAIGLLLGFTSRMLWYALEVAGGVVSAQIGWSIPAGLNPMSSGQTSEATTLLQYLAAMLFLSLNLHHLLLVAFQRSYRFLPQGGGHFSESVFNEVVGLTSYIFVFAVQMSAPLIAVSFLVTMVFALMGRAVPQMNVFHESFGVRLLAGMIVFGITLNLMGQHMVNFLSRLPEDVLRVAYLMGMARQ